MAAQDAELDRLLRPPKSRPVSAPGTVIEGRKALLSASETQQYVQANHILLSRRMKSNHQHH